MEMLIARPYRPGEHRDLFLGEHFNPGETVELVLELSRGLADKELGLVSHGLAQRGITARVECGSTPEWPDALRVKFTRPQKVKGTGTAIVSQVEEVLSGRA
jgi:hypothetical protein